MNLSLFRFLILLALFFIIFQKSYSSADRKNKELDSLVQVLNRSKTKDTTYLETLITVARKIRTEDFDQSEVYFKQAIELSRKLSATHKLIRSLNGIGITYGMYDKYADAIRYFNEAAQTALDNKLPEDLEISYSSLGIVYKRMGEYPTSLSYYIKSMALNDSLNNQEGAASTSQNLGVLFDMMKEPDKAMDYYSKSLNWYQKQNDKKKIASLQNNIGAAYLIKEDYDRALQFLNASLKENDDPYTTLDARINIGYTYYKKGEYDKAESYLRPALTDAENYKLIQAKCTALATLAKIKALQKDHAQSIALAELSKITADSINSFHIRSQAEELLSFVYEKAGRPWKALEHQKNYNALKDSIFNETKAKSYKNQQVMLEVHEKDKQLEAQNIRLAFLNQKIVLENRWKWTLGFACVFLFAAGTLYYQKYRQRRRYSHDLEAKNNIIVKQKKEIEDINLQLEKRMLRAQMNPHFIFNALSSIQHFITINDRVSALHYLSHFSNMLRQILETSVNVNMVLKDEIELIKIYLELEALRFERNFSYKINLDDELNAEAHEIPTMIIQPFVENAILHGLTPKQGERKLFIDIKENGPSIICNITDNGVGREAAEQLNKAKTGKSRSRGISVTRQRLDLLARNYGVKTDIRYNDLKDKNGKAMGTKVEINIAKQEL